MTISSLGVVSAVNEGINIPDVDQEIIVQMMSDPLILVQRVGRAVRWREGHTAQIWIVVSWGTQDEEWFKEAIAKFDHSRITYHDHTEFVTH